MSEKTRAVWAPNARAASSASQASTTTSGSASGEARFELFAGDQGAHFSVEVEAEPAPRLRFDIVVQRDDAGEVTIRVHYDPDEGRYTFAELHAAQVHLYDGRGNCDVLRRAAPDLHNAALWPPPIQPFNEVDNEVTMGELDAGAAYNIVALGLAEGGDTLTFGCVQGVTVIAERTTRVEIETRDLAPEE